MAPKDNQEKEFRVGRIFRKIKSASSGLTLLEVAVALALAAVLLPVLMQGLVMLINHGDFVYDRSILMERAQSQLESTQSQTYNYNVSQYATVSQPSGYIITLTGSTPAIYYYPSPADTQAPETMQRININVVGVRGSMDMEFYKLNLANVLPN